MIGESDVNSALVVFDRLDGGGPWDLIPISNVGEGGVLKSALRRAILLGAEIARSDRGKIYWYGNELSPPYVIRIADDRAQLLVNELPTRVVSRPPVPADTSFAMRKYKLGRRVMAARSQLSSRGYTGTELMGQLASLYQAETDLVESVRVISDQSLGVVWRGIPGEMTVRVLDRDVDPSAALQSLKLRGEELARLLDSGALVFFGAGEFVVPPSRVAQAESEVAAIRNQQSASEQSIIRNPRIREQLANPRSIDELLKENE